MELDHVSLLDSPTSWLELSRANLLQNLAGVCALAGKAEVMAVLKANAYGAGAAGMAQVLAGAGVDAFGVATVAEGVELRRSGIAGTILCMAYFTRHETEAILEHDLTPAIFTAEAARLLGECGRAAARHVSAWIKIDTGLGRLGVPFHAAPDLVREISRVAELEIRGLFSTLTENPDRDGEQVQRLLDVRRAVPESAALRLSLASSHGIVSLPACYLDMVRPGILLHGLEPSERDRMDMRLVERAGLRPIATWKARVAYVKTVARGEQIGYGWRPSLAAPARIATLTVGWADGYPAGMSQGGDVLIQGRRCPVMAVSANSTLVDLHSASATEVAANSEVVLLGRQGDAEIPAAEIARVTGSSVYRLLAAVPHDVPRVWSSHHVPYSSSAAV